MSNCVLAPALTKSRILWSQNFRRLSIASICATDAMDSNEVKTFSGKGCFMILGLPSFCFTTHSSCISQQNLQKEVGLVNTVAGYFQIYTEPCFSSKFLLDQQDLWETQHKSSHKDRLRF